jgi:hypothetical protein
VEYLIIQCLSHPTGVKLKEFKYNCITVTFDLTPLLFLVWDDVAQATFLGEFWWSEWHWDGFISEYFSFTDSIIK